MQDIISILLLAVAVNLDTFVVAISYGCSRIRISLQDSLWMAAITGVFTYLSVKGGVICADLLPDKLPEILGGGILILMGVYLVGKWLIFQRKAAKNKKASVDAKVAGTQVLEMRKLRTREVIILSCALSINNVGLGVAAGVAYIPELYTAIVTFIVTLLCLLAGAATSEKLTESSIGDYIALLTGVLIIILGVFECFS